MMTKEEYQKNLIRMWDSVRKNECKGQITCLGVRCEDCPLNWEDGECAAHNRFWNAEYKEPAESEVEG